MGLINPAVLLFHLHIIFSPLTEKGISLVCLADTFPQSSRDRRFDSYRR